MKAPRPSFIFFCVLAAAGLALASGTAEAARISELETSGTLERAARFFSLQDPSLRYALLGSLLLGLSCGLMGAFLVVRRLALMSDALSHAVLPGVALGFLWNMTRDPVAIFIGAAICGLLGAGLTHAIRSTTRHKEDAALGFVLAAFFSAGVCLLTMIQNRPGGNKSGLGTFMFGQAAAMGPADLTLLAIVAALAVGIITIFYKELLLTSFDSAFARAAGLPATFIHALLMMLLAFAIVSALQAVGVVLVSAMLVIPAAAAYLLTDRFAWMLGLSAALGMASGAAGSFFSFVGKDLSTGPLIVLSAAAAFVLALLFAPRHGIVSKWRRQHSQAARIQRENTLKALYHVLENGGFARDSVTMRELAEHRREPLETIEQQLNSVRRAGLVSFQKDRGSAVFTPEGRQRAEEIVRNHRLWELYLTTAAQYADDHVHEDAEKIEHVLGEDAVRELERQLNHAGLDPHGKPIPGSGGAPAPSESPQPPPPANPS